MDPKMEEKLKEYARLLVRVGLNVEQGQTLVISSPVECAFFARLCAAEAFPLSELGGAPFIVTDDSDAYPVVKAYEEKYGPLPDMKISSTGDATISMVACGLGVSVLPALMLRGHSAGVVVKEIAPPFFRTIIMGMRSPDELSPAARRFLDYVTQCLPELTDGGEA